MTFGGKVISGMGTAVFSNTHILGYYKTNSLHMRWKIRSIEQLFASRHKIAKTADSLLHSLSFLHPLENPHIWVSPQCNRLYRGYLPVIHISTGPTITTI
jgi:hypothetical protein